DQRFAFDAEEILTRSLTRPQTMHSGVALTTLDPTDELLYLAHHHAVHYLLLRWNWFLDVVGYLQKFGSLINWAQLRERLVKYQIQKAVGLSFRYTDTFFGELLQPELRLQLQNLCSEVKISGGELK